MAKSKKKEIEKPSPTPKEDPVEKQLAPRQTNAVAPASMMNSQVTSQDIIIPKVLAMQMMSKKVIDDEASFGEFRDSLENELLGSIKQPMEFLPFHMEKVWIEYVLQPAPTPGQQPKKKYLRTLPIITDPSSPDYNDNWRYEGENNIVRDRVMNFFCLLPSQLELGGMPYIISCRRTSLRAGKKLATQMFVKNMMAKKEPYAVVFDLLAEKTSNDQGTFVVLDVKPKRQATAEEKAAVEGWMKMIAGGAVKIDNSDVEEETDVVGAPIDVDTKEF